VLIAHVSLEPLGGLAAINRRPPAPIDLAQDVLGRHVAVLDLMFLNIFSAKPNFRANMYIVL
jgi:hypothetical protein